MSDIDSTRSRGLLEGSAHEEREAWDFDLKRLQLKPLLLVTVLELYGLCMTFPVFIFFAMKDLNMDSYQYGLTLAAFNAAQMVCCVLVGRLSDSVGRKVVLICCFLWAGVCFLLTAYCYTYTQLLIVRAMAGLSGGSFPISMAMVADKVAVRERGRYYGLLAACWSVSFTLGAGTTGLLLWFTPIERRQVFYLASTFCFLGGLVAVYVVDETLPESGKRPLCGDAADDDSPHAEARRGLSDWNLCNIGMFGIWGARFLSAFGAFCLIATYGFLVKDTLDMSEREYAIILTFQGVTGAISAGIVFPKLQPIFGSHLLCMAGGIIMSVGMFFMVPSTGAGVQEAIGRSGSIALHFSFKCLYVIGQLLIEPAIPTLVGLYVSVYQQGLGQGSTTAARNVASIFGPALAGWLYMHYGPHAPYILGGGLGIATACAISVSWIGGKPVKQEYPEEWRATKIGEVEPMIPIKSSSV